MKNILLIFGLLWALGASGQIYINSFTFAAAPAANLLLDDYPNATAAYSLRLLRTAYTGNCIVVRRASNNDTLAIGFSGNYLDTAALKTFCASTDCFVRHWYDQSGNANDLRETNSTNQPQIVASGVIRRNTNNHAGLFGGTGRRMTVPNSQATFKFLHDGTINTSFLVTQYGTSPSPASTVALWGTNAGTGSNIGAYLDGNTYSSTTQAYDYSYNVSRGGSNIVLNTSNDAVLFNTTKLIFSISDPSNATVSLRNTGYVDNGSAINNNTNTGLVNTANATHSFQIMSYGNASGNFQGFYHELVFWASNQSSSRTGIQSNINSFYNIY